MDGAAHQPDPTDEEIDDAVDRLAMAALKEARGDADLAAVMCAEAAASITISCGDKIAAAEQISDLAQFVMTCGTEMLALGETRQ